MGNNELIVFEYFLQPGYIFLNRGASLISTVLGSNVAVSLWDRKKKYGGMTNYLYPCLERGRAASSAYGNVAIFHLAKLLMNEGTKRKDIKAQVFGGAEREDRQCLGIGRKNLNTAKTILRELKIEIVSEDIGGHLGRKIVYNTENNEALIYKVNEIRQSDWYPYITDRI